MRAKVLRTFKDKYSGKTYEVGQTITVTKERFEEILTVGNLVEKIEKPKATAN